MSENQRKITVIQLEEVRLGMCLAQPVFAGDGLKLLDQGAIIETEEVLEQLRRSGVKKVLIDVGASVVDVVAEDERDQDEEAFRQELNEPDTIIENLKNELVAARKIYDYAQQVIRDVMQSIRLGKNINNQEITAAADDLIQSVSRNPSALMSLINLRKRDEYTFNHSINVAAIALSVARHLNIKEPVLQQIGVAALMHDIGKTRIPLRLLNKSTRLTPEEFDVIRMHTIYGVDICKKENFGHDIILDIVRHHHESYDGRGYPDQLDHTQISRYTSLVAIADCYDALTTDRAYKPRVDPPEAIHLINSMSNVKFDRRLVYHFIKTIGIYPVGSVVGLSSGRIAMVIGFAQRNLLNPVLKVLLDENGVRDPLHEMLVLDRSEEQISNLSPDFRFLGDLEEIF
jgi:putative nucleotidyltransferase with HDIG domain